MQGVFQLAHPQVIEMKGQGKAMKVPLGHVVPCRAGHGTVCPAKQRP